MTYPPEPYLHHQHLVEEAHWIEKVAEMRRVAGDSFRQDAIAAQAELHDLLLAAISERAQDHPQVGVLFSGGLDSSLIVAMLHRLGFKPVCITVGYQGGGSAIPADVEAARLVANHLGAEAHVRIFDEDEARAIIEETARTLGAHANAVNVGVGSVVVAAARVARELGIDVLYSGLGSEELFAGYERHAKAGDVHEECWRGLGAMWSRDLVRDTLLAKHLGITLLTPFLDPDVVICAMRIPPERKLDAGAHENKIVLREIAAPYLGVHASRKKKAAQYGSGFQKALEKEAHRRGISIATYVARLAGVAPLSPPAAGPASGEARGAGTGTKSV